MCNPKVLKQAWVKCTMCSIWNINQVTLCLKGTKCNVQPTPATTLKQQCCLYRQSGKQRCLYNQHCCYYSAALLPITFDLLKQYIFRVMSRDIRCTSDDNTENMDNGDILKIVHCHHCERNLESDDMLLGCVWCSHGFMIVHVLGAMKHFWRSQ